MNRIQAFWYGVRLEAPLLIGVLPFGMIYGALALDAGLSPAAAQAMSAIVFAGSAQFITTQLVEHGTPFVVVVLTIFVVNLRHALYSASVAPYIQHLPVRWKALLAYLLTDEAYAVLITGFQKNRPSEHRHLFYLGAGLALWLTWQTSTALGVFLGAVIPENWSLEFSLPLTFIALLAPRLSERPSLVAALAAGTTAVLFYDLPYKLWILLAALVGIAVGLWVESWLPAREPEEAV